MKLEIKNVKTTILGIQGSGKTILGKQLTKEFKNPFWCVANLDDLKGMDRNIKKIILQRKSFEEMDVICGEIIKLAKMNECDLLVIDEADLLIPKTVEKLQTTPAIHDLIVNHRHYKIAVFTITRRPADLNALVVESSEHKFIFALETSDNVVRKMKSIDSSLPDLMRPITKKSHKFIWKQLGEKPIVCNAIKLNGGKKNV